MFLGKSRDWWLEWSSTVVLIAGVALTAYNIYPLNIWVSFVGNLMWLITAWVWNKWSLVVVEIVICCIYIAGIIKIFMG
jgi:hypothetical protein